MVIYTNLTNLTREDAIKITTQGLLNTDEIFFTNFEKDHKKIILRGVVEDELVEEIYKKEGTIQFYLLEKKFEYNGETITIRSKELTEFDDEKYFRQ